MFFTSACFILSLLFDANPSMLPNAAADGIVRYAAEDLLQGTDWHEMTFVEYLRLSFEWAGL